MKRISILGSTGSIGTTTLDVVRNLPDKIAVECLAAHKNIELLEAQAHEFKPKLIAVYDDAAAQQLQKSLPNTEIVSGMEGLKAAATYYSANFIVSAITGAIGLAPTLAAIHASKDVGLANKEALIAGGQLVTAAARAKGTKLIPIDSEHSAIFQCLEGEKRQTLSRIILTASGGPFRNYTQQELESVSVKDALRHPTWNMGAKVTIDSSTLMNKGLEMIEAHWLFAVDPDHIDVVVHPQSIIHSMVEFNDGSIIAQMSKPTMAIPIQYSITYPDRYPGLMPPFDFKQNGNLQFFTPDLQKFRCLQLAYDAIRVGGSMPCYMNAVNEVLVGEFAKGRLSWIGIATGIDELMSGHKVSQIATLEDIFDVDDEARREAAEYCRLKK